MSNINMVALHHAAQTSVRVWVRSIVSGTLAVSLPGQTQTAAVDTAIEDGCAVVEFTGLSAGQSYPFSASVDGTVIGSGTARTMPADGATFSLGFGTCVGYLRDALPLRSLMQARPDLAGFCWLGDNVYVNEPTGGTTVTVNGETLTRLESTGPTVQATAMAQLYRHYRAYFQMPATRRMLEAVPNWFAFDDHDHMTGNDYFRGDLASANNVATWASTPTHLTNMETWCHDAARAYTKGNPNWSGSDFYFSVRVNDALELFFVDGVWYRDAPDGSGTTLLGSAQKAWLLNAIETSTATFKAVMTKNLWGGADDFSKYAAERAELEAFINSYPDWAVPGGLVWCSGDIHYPMVSYKAATPMVNVCSSPLGTGYNTFVSDGGYATGGLQRLWKSSGNVSLSANDTMSYPAAAYIRPHGHERIEVGVVDNVGNTRWRGFVAAGTNELHYDRQRVA